MFRLVDDLKTNARVYFIFTRGILEPQDVFSHNIVPIASNAPSAFRSVMHATSAVKGHAQIPYAIYMGHVALYTRVASQSIKHG